MEAGQQIIKTRDDRLPVFLNMVTDAQANRFALAEGNQCSWWPAGENQIEPRDL